METEAGQFALLPDGGRVRIEIVHSDGYVTARRIQGKWEGQIVVCAQSTLKQDHANMNHQLAPKVITTD